MKFGDLMRDPKDGEVVMYVATPGAWPVGPCVIVLVERKMMSLGAVPADDKFGSVTNRPYIGEWEPVP